jgi:SAM-dependent methyltransferase
VSRNGERGVPSAEQCRTLDRMSAPNPAEMYESYMVPAIFAPLAKSLVELAATQDGERVLDVACGTGIVARELASRADVTVTGLDINPAMLAVARDRAPGATFVEGSGVALPLPDAGFELVTCQQGLQFFPDRAAGAREMRRVVAPGGRAALAVWKSVDHHEFFRAFFEAQGEFLGVPAMSLAPPFSLGDPAELRAIVEDAGFDRVELTEATIQARFPNPEQFVKMTAMAGAAVMPDLFGKVDPAAMTEHVRSRVGPTLDRYRDGDHLQFPMTTHFVLAS